MRICFPFHQGTLCLVLEGFLNSTLVISLWKKAPTLHFYSSQYAENRREKTTSYLRACIFRNHYSYVAISSLRLKIE